jgi:hypothetical protein
MLNAIKVIGFAPPKGLHIDTMATPSQSIHQFMRACIFLFVWWGHMTYLELRFVSVITMQCFVWRGSISAAHFKSYCAQLI